MGSGKATLTSINAAAVIDSPCIGVCTLGPGDICIGCLRTSVEIGNWASFTAQQRNHIKAALPQRLEALFAK